MILNRVTSQDVSKFPDQAAYKINRMMDELERIANIVDNNH